MNSKIILRAGLLIFSTLFWCCSEAGVDPPEINTIQIGALVPLSGAFASQGDEILAAISYAAEDINKSFVEEGKATRIELIYTDTQTDPEIAKIHLNTMITKDIRVVIGPLTSVEVIALKEDVDPSNTIMISPGSTLTSLAIADDNIFRMVTDDAKMAEAVVEVMWDQGIRHLAMLNIDNTWGDSLVSLMRDQFRAKGGSFLGAIPYIGARNSELSEYLGELSDSLESETSTLDPSTIAIHMISLDVGGALLDLASADTTLGKFRWFGCDGFVNADELFIFENGGSFAEEVGFTSPIYGFETTAASQALLDRIRGATQSTPGTYALLAYDAMTLAATVLDETGADVSINELREKLTSKASTLAGVTGNLELNSAGDRLRGSYFFWQVIEDGDQYKWEQVFTYADGVIF